MESHRLCRPSLELLENRWTPAGTVTGSFANGTWTLIGDAEANDIRINPTAILNQFEVTGQNGTAVAGVTNPGNVQHIVVRLRAGDDYLEVNSTGASARLRGDLKVFGGAGANYVDIRDFRMKNLTITNGVNTSGYDYLYLVDSIVQKNVTINNGAGDSETGIYRTTPGLSSIGGNVTVINGAGADGTYLCDIHVRGNVTVKNGLPDAGGEAGYVEIFNEKNKNSRSIILGNVLVSYQGGTVDYDGIWDTEVLGNVKFNYGSSNSELYIDGYSVVQPVHIHGNLTVIGQGNTFVNIGLQYEQTGLIVGKNFTVLTGAGADDITMNRLSVGGATILSTGAGNDKIVIDDSYFAGLTTIRTGAGNDDVFIESTNFTDFGTQFARAMNLNLGAGDDLLSVGTGNDGTRLMEVFGPATLDGGADTDTFERYNVASGLGKAINALFETTVV